LEHVPTIFDTYTADVPVLNEAGAEEVIEISLWDTAGQSELDKYRPIAYPGTDIFLVCFGLDSPAAFENARSKWVPEIRRELPGVPFALVGTKKDLRDGLAGAENPLPPGMAPPGYGASTEFVRNGTGAAAARETGAATYCECSALTQEGLKAVFDEAIRAALARRRAKAPSAAKRRPGCLLL
jgi:GTPase SAR1 family protein